MSGFVKAIEDIERPILYVTFLRHGMRAPIKNPFDAALEVEAWIAELPSKSILDDLSSKFPVRVHKNNPPEAFDTKNYPFGCITTRGVNHLVSIGNLLKSSFPAFQNLSSLKVYSTNYQRTQASAQSLLLGLEAPEGTDIEVRLSPVEFRCMVIFLDRFVIVLRAP